MQKRTIMNPADGDNWPLWIINTFLAIGAAMTAIIGTLLKLVDSKYRTEQAELKAQIVADRLTYKTAIDEEKTEACHARMTMKAEFKEALEKIEKLHRQCDEDRRLLSNRVSVLEAKE